MSDNTQNTQVVAEVTPDEQVKTGFAKVIAVEQELRAKLRTTRAKLAEYEAPLVDIRKMVETAKANVEQAEKLGATMAKVPGGDVLHKTFVATAQQGVTQAEQALGEAQNALPGDYQDFRSIEASQAMELEQAEKATAEAKQAVVEYLTTKDVEELAALAVDSFLGRAPAFKSNTGTGKPRKSNKDWPDNPTQDHTVIVSGTEYPAQVTEKDGKVRISFPKLKEALIAAGVPQEKWNGVTETGKPIKTTTFRVARDSGLAELKGA